MPDRKLVFCLIFSFFLVACLGDAKRGNPLDPKADDFKNSGQVTVAAMTFYSPHAALPNVEVRLQPGSFISNTNGNGRLVFTDVSVGNYLITGSRPGFATFSDSISVGLGQNTTIEMKLDGLPFAKLFEVTSCRIGRWFPTTDLLLLEVKADVDDSDGVSDIQLVELDIPEINFTDTLDITTTPGIFAKKIKETDLPPGKKLQNLLGKQIFLNILDRTGVKTVSMPKTLIRIIDSKPQTESPQGIDNIVDPANLILTWRAATNLPHDFSYQTSIFQVNFGVNFLIWSSGKIDQVNTSVNASQILPSGAYAWTISIVDEFGNCSSSKEASFRVN